jgi:hypothetical protein
MSVGIYKIENLLTHKPYIGQSIHIETRWQEHCRSSSDSVISRAIRKYGKENFSFEILEECEEEELNKKEEYYIQLYNSIIPNGYNVEEKVEGGRRYFLNYSKDDFNNIVFDIKSSELSFSEIADKYSIDISMIYYINRGDYHTIVGETYPLRKVKTTHVPKYCIDCGAQIHVTSNRCPSCDHIRQQKCKHPTREELKDLIRNNSFLQISKMYGVSDNAIRKWCISYNLPIKRPDIKNIDENKWEEI